jgi:hypothetical protein
MKKVLAPVITVGLLSVLVAACGQGTVANSSSSSSSHVTNVHMGTQSFLQSSVTIQKGDSLNLINNA